MVDLLLAAITGAVLFDLIQVMLLLRPARGGFVKLRLPVGLGAWDIMGSALIRIAVAVPAVLALGHWSDTITTTSGAVLVGLMAPEAVSSLVGVAASNVGYDAIESTDLARLEQPEVKEVVRQDEGPETT